MPVYTIGHSTRTVDELVAALQSFNVTELVDVRTMPRSRHTPQFNEDQLRALMPERGIRYQHVAALGGLRHSRKDSTNTGWHNASFRGYADYMQTQGFLDGLAELEAIIGRGVTAIMCAEAVPWRCRRSMIGDALLVRSYDVFDIFEPGKARPEKLTAFARVVDADGEPKITYPPEE